MYCFPVVNDERVCGLTERLRRRALFARDQLLLARSELAAERRSAGGGAGHALEAKLLELEARVLTDNVEKLRLREEKQALYEKVRLPLVRFRGAARACVCASVSVCASEPSRAEPSRCMRAPSPRPLAPPPLLR